MCAEVVAFINAFGKIMFLSVEKQNFNSFMLVLQSKYLQLVCNTYIVKPGGLS